MNKHIQEDCYFYIDGDEDDPDTHMVRGMCIECHDNLDKPFGWFYPGRQKGYGDYDSKCSVCERVICQRNEKYAD